MKSSMENFMELTINEVSDLLLNDLHERGDDKAGALLIGRDDEDKPYRLTVILESDIDV